MGVSPSELYAAKDKKDYDCVKNNRHGQQSLVNDRTKEDCH